MANLIGRKNLHFTFYILHTCIYQRFRFYESLSLVKVPFLSTVNCGKSGWKKKLAFYMHLPEISILRILSLWKSSTLHFRIKRKLSEIHRTRRSGSFLRGGHQRLVPEGGQKFKSRSRGKELIPVKTPLSRTNATRRCEFDEEQAEGRTDTWRGWGTVLRQAARGVCGKQFQLTRWNWNRTPLGDALSTEGPSSRMHERRRRRGRRGERARVPLVEPSSPVLAHPRATFFDAAPSTRRN